jgi:hypothetical protein
MKKIPKPKESKEEKARRTLCEAIRDRLSEMRHCLKCLSLDKKMNEGDDSTIHGVIKGIYDMESIFWDILFDDASAAEILECRIGCLRTRIFPI